MSVFGGENPETKGERNMRRGKVLCGILTVLVMVGAGGCGIMQGRTDNVLEPQGATAFERALEYEEQQELKLAAKEYRRALEEDPADSRCWVNLGLIHEREGRKRHAVACWYKAIRVNPGDARAYNLLGNVWKENGQHTKAIAYYRRAIQADPKYADPHWNMAAAFRHLKMERDAGEHYLEFIQVASAYEHEDVVNAKIFLAELDRKGMIIDRPEAVQEPTAFAEAEPAEEPAGPSEEEQPSEPIVLEGDLADLFIGDAIQFAETEAEPDAEEEAPVAEEMTVPEVPPDVCDIGAAEEEAEQAVPAEAPVAEEMTIPEAPPDVCEPPAEEAAEPAVPAEEEKATDAEETMPDETEEDVIEKAAADLDRAEREKKMQVRAEREEKLEVRAEE